MQCGSSNTASALSWGGPPLLGAALYNVSELELYSVCLLLQYSKLFLLCLEALDVFVQCLSVDRSLPPHSQVLTLSLLLLLK